MNSEKNMQLPCQHNILQGFYFTGNIMILHSIYSHKELQTPTNFFLTSLAVADLLITLIFPIEAVSLNFSLKPLYFYLCIRIYFSNGYTTNITLRQFWSDFGVVHQSLTAGFSGDDKHGYCLCTGPILVSRGVQGADNQVCRCCMLE